MTVAFTPDQIEHAARQLADARRNVSAIEGLGSLTPPDVATAQAISDAHADALGWDVIGWKIGCTSEAAMKILGSPGPFAGRIFDGSHHGSGQLAADAMINPQVECEFGFLLGADLLPREDDYSIADVKAATEAVAPAIELVAPRFTDFTGVGWLSLVADHGANGGIVLGEPVPSADVPELRTVEVTCTIDGEVDATGTGEAILGDPWNALVWLANHLSGRGLSLSAGHVVMSGTCTGIARLEEASTASASHVGLGEVSITRAAGDSLALE